MYLDSGAHGSLLVLCPVLSPGGQRGPACRYGYAGGKCVGTLRRVVLARAGRPVAGFATVCFIEADGWRPRCLFPLTSLLGAWQGQAGWQARRSPVSQEGGFEDCPFAACGAR